MARRITHVLFAKANYTGPRLTTKVYTGEAIELQGPVVNGILYYKVYNGGSTGTSPTMDLKVQGAPKDENVLYTALHKYRNNAATGPLTLLATFPQTTTAATIRVAYLSDYTPKFIRAIFSMAGSAPSFTAALYLDATEI